jgi:hypothetical protein
MLHDPPQSPPLPPATDIVVASPLQRTLDSKPAQDRPSDANDTIGWLLWL